MNRKRQHLAVALGPHIRSALLLASILACAGGDTPRSADTTATATPAPAASVASVSGEQIYQVCVTCHQANGEGVAGTFPPLAGSEYATASNVAVPIRIVLRGMQGPVTVKGAPYNGVMAPYGTGAELSDEQVAAVLTYVRSSWGNAASAVTPQQVAAERPAAKAAGGAVTAEELKALL